MDHILARSLMALTLGVVLLLLRALERRLPAR